MDGRYFVAGRVIRLATSACTLLAVCLLIPGHAADFDAAEKSLQRMLPRIEPLHTPMQTTKPGDWLESHPEPGQSFRQYIREDPVVPRGKRRVIYVLPLGEFNQTQLQLVEQTLPVTYIVANPYQHRVTRTIGFVDLGGFTNYTETEGDEAAVSVLQFFRAATREICALRGVRIAKWLGDGAMLVGVEPNAPNGKFPRSLTHGRACLVRWFFLLCVRAAPLCGVSEIEGPPLVAQ